MPTPSMSRRNIKGQVPDDVFYSLKDIQDRLDSLSQFTPYSGVTAAIGGSALTAGQTVSSTVKVPGASAAVAAGAAIQATPVLNGAPGPGFTWNAFLTTAKDVVEVVVTCIANGTPIATKFNVKVVP